MPRATLSGSGLLITEPGLIGSGRIRSDIVVTIRQGTRLQVTGQAAVAVTAKPGPITNFNAVATSDVIIDLSWTNPTSGGVITGLELNRSPTGTGSWSANLLTGIATTFTDINKAASTLYFYRIRAVSGTSFGDYATDSVSTPPTQVTIGTPTNFQANAVSSTRIDLSWAAGAGTPPTSYELDRSLTGTGGWLNILSSLATTFQHSGLTANTTYFYRVRAIASGMQSAYAVANETTIVTPPGTFFVSNHPNGPSWPSGVGEIYTASGYNTWKNWSSREPDVCVAWAGQEYMSSWAQIRTGGSTKFPNALSVYPSTTTIIHRFPLAPRDAQSNRNFANPALWDSLAGGAHDDDFDAAFAAMKQMAINAGRTGTEKRIGLSLGWEFSGWWYAYSLSTSKLAQYKTTFKNISAIFKSHFPTGPVDWPPARTWGGDNQTLTIFQMHPDPSSFDAIGRSLHNDNPHSEDAATWLLQYDPPASRKLTGLLHCAQLAQQLGKKICFSEWATNMADCGGGHVPGPNQQFFLNRVADYFEEFASLMAWDAYFSPSCTNLSTRPSTPEAQAYDLRWNN